MLVSRSLKIIRPPSCALSGGLTLSVCIFRRRHQATPEAIEQNGAVRAVYIDTVPSRLRVEEDLDMELKANSSQIQLSPSFSNVSAVEKQDDTPPLLRAKYDDANKPPIPEHFFAEEKQTEDLLRSVELFGSKGRRVNLPLPDQVESPT